MTKTINHEYRNTGTLTSKVGWNRLNFCQQMSALSMINECSTLPQDQE